MCQNVTSTDTKPDRRKRDSMKCVKCERTFRNYDNLEAHMRSHFGKKVGFWVLTFLGIFYTTLPPFTLSMFTLQPDVRCKECHKTFSTTKTLASHMRVHTGDRKYQCLRCGKSFAYLNVLKNHEQTHAGVKGYECHVCGARFLQHWNLKVRV